MSRTDESDNSGKLWREVVERLSGEVADGVFKPGERLANERDLAQRYGVHRHTLRRAVAELAGRGLLEVRHGRGTFVQNAPIPYRVGAESRFQQNVAQLSREPGGRLISATTLAAPLNVAKKLGLAPGDEVIKLEIIREIDGVPMILSEHWFPACFSQIASRFENEQSITRALEALGVRGLKRTHSGISTRLPTSKEAVALRQPPVEPILVWESLKRDENDAAVDFGVALIAGKRVQLVFDLG